MYKALLVAAIIVNTLPRWIGEINLWDHKNIYYTGQAFSFLLLLLAQGFYTKTKWNLIIYNITIGLALSNLIDELFFDPVHFGINELVFALIISITTIHKAWNLKA